MRSLRGMLAPVLKLAVFAVVTVFFTALLGVTIANVGFGDRRAYVARFSDVLGLNEGDDVRMSGVRVGQVREIEPVTPEYAEVRFTVDAGRAIAADATAALKYRNLIGQRYVDLDSGAPGPGEELPEGGTIPLERTTPAVNLTELLGGFKPLLQALEPADVNRLSAQLIQVLQGEGGTIESVLAHTASLTTTLANRDDVIGRVITNLNTVLDTVNGRGDELGTLLDETQRLVSGLAAQREPIGEAVDAMGELATSTSGLLAESRQPLRDSIAGLRELSGNLNDSAGLVERFLRTLPGKTATLTRVVSYGSWLNFYLCGLSGDVGIGALNVEVPLTPLPLTQAAPRCRP